MAERKAAISRETRETQIDLNLVIGGSGQSEISTGIGFFDHMLVSLAVHSMIDLKIKAKGDRNVDQHHTVEDVGICLGRALREAVGDKAGIYRFGYGCVPMDESLVEAVIDFSGRGHLVFNGEIPAEHVGDFETSCIEEFLRALAVNAGLTLHVNVRYGTNPHHMIEAMFKALARALLQALAVSEGVKGIPSSKGVL